MQRNRTLTDHLNEGLRYVAMTGVSAVLSLGIPFILHEGFSVSPNIAVAAGLATVFLVNFATLKLYVFKRKGSVAGHAGRYAFVSILFRVSEYLAFLLLHGLFEVQYMWALTAILVVSISMKFLAYKLYVFTHRQKPLVDGL